MLRRSILLRSGQGRKKPQANLRPFGAPPSKGRREKQSSGIATIYTPRRFHNIMRRTTPVEPVEPSEPVAPPLHRHSFHATLSSVMP